jgi:hypothetical protein
LKICARMGETGIVQMVFNTFSPFLKVFTVP